MNRCGLKKAIRALVPLFLLILTFSALSSFAASGVLIFSSWDTQEKATKDAERISGILEQQATTMQATVNDRTVYRVVVAVSTDEDRTALKQTAAGKNLQSWFLATETSSEAEGGSDAADAASTSGAGEGSTTGDLKVVLSVSDADPDEVLNYLDQANIDSTIAKLDAVLERARSLIPDFEPRSEELPPIEDSSEVQQGEQESDTEEQTETSSETSPETSSTE